MKERAIALQKRARRLTGEIIVTNSAAKIPKRRSNGEDQETKDELRIALALEAGTATEFTDVTRSHFERALRALAPATKTAIASDLDCFVDWCQAHKHTAFPADAETVAKYVEWREEAGAKLGTIRRRVASISTGHRMLDMEPEGPRSQKVRTALQAVKQSKGSKQRQAFGLRLGAEEEVRLAHKATLNGLLAVCDETLTGLRDGALLSAGYDAGLRVSELTAMAVEDLQLQSDMTGRFQIRRSKTDQGGEGKEVWLSADTMRRVARWLEEANIQSGVVFRRVHVTRSKAKSAIAPETWNSIPGQTRHYQERLEGSSEQPSVTVYTPGTDPLTRQGINEIYRRIAAQAWAEGQIDVPKNDIVGFLKELSSHSLRVGLTQDLIANGQDGVAIAKALRWKSTARVLHYGQALEPGSGAAQDYLKNLRK